MHSRNYKVFAGVYNLGHENLHEPVSNSEEILICPVVSGAGAVGRIIAGALLIAAAIFIPAGFAIFGVGIAGLLFTVGASLVLGGVAQLLSPNKTSSSINKDIEEIQSYNFSGIQNTSRQGVPIPICYGEIVTGSIVVSASIRTEDTGSTGDSPFGNVFGAIGLG
jgi:predicted phage tail protein